MSRSFDGTPVDVESLAELCAEALWSPTAGNAAGVRFHIIDAPHVREYFEVATDAEWRETSRRYDGLARAGAAVLVTSRPEDYLARYAESDKSSSGLFERDAWPLPYWHTDAAMATMALLLLLEESGWQATIWGNFRHDAAVRAWAGLGDEELFASVLIGRADGKDARSSSLEREVPLRRERVRRVF
ncbi:MAG: nitroreductase family protein [Acidimicrobiales bacterium]|jgi:nitroreductase